MVRVRLYFSGLCNGVFLASILLNLHQPSATDRFALSVIIFFVGLLLNPGIQTWKGQAAISAFFGALLLAVEPICTLLIGLNQNNFLVTRVGGCAFLLAGVLFFAFSKRKPSVL